MSVLAAYLFRHVYKSLKLLSYLILSQLRISAQQVSKDHWIHGQTFISSYSIVPDSPFLDLLLIELESLGHAVIVELDVAERADQSLERIHQ